MTCAAFSLQGVINIFRIYHVIQQHSKLFVQHASFIHTNKHYLYAEVLPMLLYLLTCGHPMSPKTLSCIMVSVSNYSFYHLQMLVVNSH